MNTHQDMLSYLTQIVRQAGVKAMDIYNHHTDDDIFTKDDQSPVTVADYAVEEMVTEALLRLTPDIPIVGEETVAKEKNEHGNILHEKTFWLVDPIDGTREFIKKNGQFTINIALIEEGKATLGVIFAPAFDKLYMGGVHASARYVHGDVSRDMRVNPFYKDQLRVVTNGGHDKPFEYHFPYLRLKESLLCGSSLKFCMIANGEADFYPRLGPTCEWDTAAGQAILEAAGGCVLTYDAPYTSLFYGRHNPGYKNPFFMACGASEEQMRDILKSYTLRSDKD